MLTDLNCSLNLSQELFTLLFLPDSFFSPLTNRTSVCIIATVTNAVENLLPHLDRKKN